MSKNNTPILKVGSTRVWRTYLGGAKLDIWHGAKTGEVGNFAEDWVASTVSAKTPGREHLAEGMSEVINLDGKPLLAQILEENASGYFGEKHANVLGANSGMLIKLIDSYERLTIQVHPDKEFAKTKFNSDYGKTESWYILDTQEIDGQPACIYFGFKEGITRQRWKEIFEAQDINAMLDCLHKIEVKAGDSFFIPGGLPHAIGAGCLLAEVQEPTDYTIRTERVTPAGLKIHDTLCHQGLGFDVMFDCFHYNGQSLDEITKLLKPQPKVICSDVGGELAGIIDERNTNLFQMNKISVKSEFKLPFDERLKVWIITAGEGELICADQCIKIAKGDYVVIPANNENISVKTLKGVEIIECLPQKID